MSAFPSLLIRAEKLVPTGAFAESQAQFLRPDPEAVKALDALCREKKIGVCAHFYMDVELQAVLTACEHEHVIIADSLKMADAAVKMAEAGMNTIIVLGVDFMSENVRAVLDSSGHADVRVFRLAKEEIGCSLAESAEGEAYASWLKRASSQPMSLHVVYINTSLETKALAHSKVPTITCTSSNVVQTILQATSQLQGLSIWYGPDTYMGYNLKVLFEQYTKLSDEEIQEIHPAHTRKTIEELLLRLHVFPSGNCVVHHLFGDEVVKQVREDYATALITAHLEVPGEMFALAQEAALVGRGAVGSTSNILAFIVQKLESALQSPESVVLDVVLGTEAGMITPIVDRVQTMLQQSGREDVAVNVIFPVAAEAITKVDSPLGIVPGVPSGEGCSVAGGCATCPFMKMNDLEALLTVAGAVNSDESELSGYEPKKYTRVINGRTAAELGIEPIRFMRHYQKTGEMDVMLLDQVRASS